MQWKSFNVITLEQRETEYNIRIIMVTKSTLYLHYVL
jgi:hypothetical protein